ncbi:hypothetical protein Q8F55_008501 [Vanrija albida]|uniref:Uncharacterized protein n=1 Tax=Vanrija albida TaxID=181172 RepID=A0ABR3PR09_9TREE
MTLQRPGLGLPLDHNTHLAHSGRDNKNNGFPSAVLEESWKSNTPTVRERAILAFVDSITDKPEWWTKIDNDDITAKWRAEINAAVEAKAEPYHKGFSGDMFDFALNELRDKAKIYKESGYVSVLDLAASVIKADGEAGVPEALRTRLIDAVRPLENVPNDEVDWHPGSNGLVRDIVHPSLFPLVYGKTRYLADREIKAADALQAWGSGEVVPALETDADVKRREKWFKQFTAKDNKAKAAEAGEGAPAAAEAEAEANADADADSDAASTGSFNYERWQARRAEEEKAKRARLWSSRFQWLPSEVDVSADGKATFASYINNLHPVEHKELYGVLEDLVTASLPLLDAAYGRVMNWNALTNHAAGAKTTPPFDPSVYASRIVCTDSNRKCLTPAICVKDGWCSEYNRPDRESSGDEQDNDDDDDDEDEADDDNTQGADADGGPVETTAEEIAVDEAVGGSGANPAAEAPAPADELDTVVEAIAVDEDNDGDDDGDDDDDDDDDDSDAESSEYDPYAGLTAEEKAERIAANDARQAEYERKQEERKAKYERDAAAAPPYEVLFPAGYDFGYDTGDDEYEKNTKWHEHTHPPQQPEPAEYKFVGPTSFNKGGEPLFALPGVTGVKLGARRLQVIVKLANIELTPEKPKYNGGSWHIEGQLNERICGTALYYYDNENITPSRLAFRTPADAEGFTEGGFEYEQGDHSPFEAYYGVNADMDGDSTVVPVGDVATPQGRLLAFPNVLQHCVSSFELVDKTKPGHRKIVALFLVDPQTPVVSTAHVPPQQASWGSIRELDSRLPAELQHQIYADLGCPYSLDEAKQIRAELMGERKAIDSDIKENFELLSWNFCEH